jgi:hypothetical protein
MILPKEFGEGWLSRRANDLVRLACFSMTDGEAKDFVNKLTLAGSTEKTVNIRTVEKVLQGFYKR